MKDKGKMKMSELELESGVPRTRINYYLREGLLHPPEKTGLTMAYYDHTHLERLRSIEKIKMDYLKENGKFRMPVSLLRKKLGEHMLTTEDKYEKYTQARESDYEFSMQRKQDIIDAAAMLYTKNGYYHTSLRDIASKVGISPSSIYLYFPDKRELFAAVIDQTINMLNDEVEREVATGGDARQIFRSSFQIYSDYYPKLGEIVYQLRAGVVVGDEWAKERIKEIYSKMAALLKITYRYAMDLGILRELDLDLLTYYVISVVEALFQRRDLDDRHTPDEILSFFMDVVLNGIGSSQQIA